VTQRGALWRFAWEVVQTMRFTSGSRSCNKRRMASSSWGEHRLVPQGSPMRSRHHFSYLVVFLTLGAAGCAPTASSGPNTPSSSSCETLYPKSQTISQPCCPAWGIDACGANLVCAALDGRTQPTCYAERSRVDLSECSADVQCVSGSCNLEVKQCRSHPHTVCDWTVGCAANPAGAKYGCKTTWATSVEAPRCEPLGNGEPNSFCVANSDCRQGQCFDHACLPPPKFAGELCNPETGSFPEPCAQGYCLACNQAPSYIFCQQPTHIAECLLNCPDQTFRSSCTGEPPASLRAPVRLSCRYSATGPRRRAVIEWIDSSTNEVSFQIFRATEGVETLVGTAPANTTLWLDTVLPSGNYEYRVRAAAGSEYSQPSEPCTLAL
jgi:hypothetical protein